MKICLIVKRASMECSGLLDPDACVFASNLLQAGLEPSAAPGTHSCAAGPPSSQTGGRWCVQLGKGRGPWRERCQAASTVVSGFPCAQGNTRGEGPPRMRRLGHSLSNSIHTQLLSEVWSASCSPGGRLDGELRVCAAGCWQGPNGDWQRVCQGGHVSFLTYSWAAGGPGA